MSSSSSTEALRLEAGVEVAGFRLERELGRGARAVVWEATQVGLDRRVALKLLGDELPERLRWPEHPRVVPLYAAGSWSQGGFVAMRLLRGPTLARRLAAGPLDPAAATGVLADVAAALDAAHGAGIAHGDVSARNVWVDGTGGVLSDFGLAGGEATVAADRTDFAALVRACLGAECPPLPNAEERPAEDLVEAARAGLPAPAAAEPQRRGRPGALGAAVAAAGVAAAVAAGILLTGATDAVDPSPPVPRGAIALGSALPPTGVTSVDCQGRAPTGGSPACTVLQTVLPGRRLDPPRAGAIRSWAVRGARGDLALQVIRRRGDRWVSVATTGYVTLPDGGVRVLPAGLAVRPGDRVGLQMAPGAAIGTRPSTGSATARWIGPILIDARPLELGPGTGLDRELLLRVDYAPGARPEIAGALTGPEARRAPAGRELSSREVEVGGALRRVAVVRLEGAVVLDLFAGDRRVARLPARDAEPGGRLLSFIAGYGRPVLRWRNPGGRAVAHEYAVESGALTLRR